MIRKIFLTLFLFQILASLTLAAGPLTITGKITPDTDFLPIKAEVWMEKNTSLVSECATFIDVPGYTNYQADMQDFNPAWQDGDVVVAKVEKENPAESGAGFYGNTSLTLPNTEFPDIDWGTPRPIPQPTTTADMADYEVDLSWAPAAGTHVLGYNVWRSTDGIIFLKINKNLITGETYSDNTSNSSILPVGGQAYYYAIRIVFGVYGQEKETIYRSLKSNQVTYPAGSPHAPTGFSGTPLSPTTIRWSWNDNSNNETGFRLHDDSHTSMVGDLPIDTTQVDESGLSPNTPHTRHANAFNADGDSESSSDSVYTLANDVTSVVATVEYDASDGHHIHFSWDLNGATSVRIYDVTNDTDVYTGSDTSTTVTNLIGSTSYTYRIFSRNAVGAEGSSYVEISKTTLSGPPAAPSGFSGSALSATSIHWSWTDNSDNEDGFRLHNESHASLVGDLAADTTQVDESGLSPNTQYARHINAYNAYGSEDSNVIFVYTLADDVSSVVATAEYDTTNGHHVDLSWNLNGATSVRVYNATTGTDIYIGSGTSVTDKNLDANTNYTYHIYSRNGNGVENSSSYVEISIGSTPSITSITPIASVAGSRFALVGTGFGDSQGASKVVFENKNDDTVYEAEIISWSDNLIRGIVPVTADAEDYEVKVIRIAVVGVTENELESNAVNFQITAAASPGIASIWPNPFDPGTESLNIAFVNTSGATSFGIYIYDSVGRLVYNEVTSSTTLTWDGTDQQNATVGDGVFLLRIVNAENKSLIAKGKILLIKR